MEFPQQFNTSIHTQTEILQIGSSSYVKQVTFISKFGNEIVCFMRHGWVFPVIMLLIQVIFNVIHSNFI